MSRRPLASDIGATENALRDLLTQVLADTAIDGYRQWVFLNVREAYGDAVYRARVAQVLHEDAAVVADTEAALMTAGLLGPDRALTPRGSEVLAEARLRIGAVTSELTAGIDEVLIDAARDVLNTVRERAEALLS